MGQTARGGVGRSPGHLTLWPRRKRAYERQLKEHGLPEALRLQPAY